MQPQLEFKIEAKGVFAHCNITPVCPKCNGSTFIFELDENRPHYRIAKPCYCRKYVIRSNIYNTAKIPSNYWDATLDNFETVGMPNLKKVLAAVKKKLVLYKNINRESPVKGLVIYGGYGSGKTRLVCAILRELILDIGLKSLFIEFASLINQIKHGYDNNEYEAKFLTPLLEVDVLAIDELGKGRKSQWEQSILDQIISKRYFAKKTTFFTTNYTISKAPPDINSLAPLSEMIEPRVYSRLFEMCDFIEVDSRDYRKYPTEVVEIGNE